MVTCRSVFAFCGFLFLSVVIVVLIRTFTLSVRTDTVDDCTATDEDFIRASDKIISNFRRALQIKTVSKNVHEYDTGELLKLQQLIRTAYPVIHSSPLVKLEVIGNYSLLYSIKGSNSSLTPYMLCSHLDVVPAEPQKWDAPPFAADIKDGYIYARGTIDFKHGVMGILEAVEYSLSRGFKPQRSFYLAFGHDEEVGGSDGARAISERLKAQHVKLEFIVDEGMVVTDGLVPGMTKPAALIGTSEKGQAMLRLTVTQTAGHSSMPPKESTIGILAHAIHKLESVGQPRMFGYGPEKYMFEHLAQDMTFSHKLVMSNLWLFGPIVSWVLSRKPVTDAMIRTVTSVTMIQGGIKANVVPPEASAIVNHRIHPAQSVQDVIDYDRKLIDDDRVKIEIMDAFESLPQSPFGDDDFGYQMVKNSIRQVWLGVVVAPATLIGNTDTRHYVEMTKNIYRFSPTYMYPEDMARFHGDNERISVKDYEKAINFYYHLISNANKELEPSHKHGEL
ncbi:N-fatty-acyl-amino acid synthase/hydrolase PM20D1.1-like [Gigantopelta aegis]|uniref:N-fatty-acyl-amino acid synthase/hydrolase PM20D1.1-like n=1 Tax=Gigantopelta aegis TaxID=1735272 RepID=UPI001B88BA51|nr:N-fatty-acyl-amino acid synthase/hydrolase PM20D1.1-like [Gigantopelta aegis]